MDVDGSVYEDLGKVDDDSDLYGTSGDDYDDDSGTGFGSIYAKNEEGGLAGRFEQGPSFAALAKLVFGLSLAICIERLIDGLPSSVVLLYFSCILAFSKLLIGSSMLVPICLISLDLHTSSHSFSSSELFHCSRMIV
jgi:hypothetical protein